MKKSKQAVKIDLTEIALIAESLRHREDEMLPKGWKAMRKVWFKSNFKHAYGFQTPAVFFEIYAA